MKNSWILLLYICSAVRAQVDTISFRWDLDFVEVGCGVGIRTKVSELPGRADIFINSAKQYYTTITTPGPNFYFKNKWGFGTHICFMFSRSNNKYRNDEFYKSDPTYYRQIDQDVGGPSFILWRIGLQRNYELRKWLRIVPYGNFVLGAGNNSLSNTMGYKKQGENFYFEREYRFDKEMILGTDFGIVFKLKETITDDNKTFAGFLIRVYVSYLNLSGIASFKDIDYNGVIIDSGQSKFQQNNLKLGVSGLLYLSNKKLKNSKRNKKLR